MVRDKSSTRRRCTLLASCLLALLAAAPGARAASDPTSINLLGGTLDYTTALAADDFPDTTLNGVQQTKTADIEPYVVTDSRGGTAGWHLTIAASQFTTGTDTLPLGSLTMTTPPVPTTTLGNVGVAPVPQAVTNPIDDGSTQTMVSAAALPLSGAGKWTFTPLTGALSLTVPPAVAPGTYTSTITTTLATGP